jgi:hypothetical protein
MHSLLLLLPRPSSWLPAVPVLGEAAGRAAAAVAAHAVGLPARSGRVRPRGPARAATRAGPLPARPDATLAASGYEDRAARAVRLGGPGHRRAHAAAVGPRGGLLAHGLLARGGALVPHDGSVLVSRDGAVLVRARRRRHARLRRGVGAPAVGRPSASVVDGVPHERCDGHASADHGVVTAPARAATCAGPAARPARSDVDGRSPPQRRQHRLARHEVAPLLVAAGHRALGVGHLSAAWWPRTGPCLPARARPARRRRARPARRRRARPARRRRARPARGRGGPRRRSAWPDVRTAAARAGPVARVAGPPLAPPSQRCRLPAVAQGRGDPSGAR